MVNWVYMLEPQLEHLVTRYDLNCSTSDLALIKNVHWKRRKLQYEDRVFNYELPILVNGRKFGDAVQRVRLVYDIWRDHIDYPKFRKRLLDTTVTTGHTMNLDVEVTGSPDLEVKWYKDGVTLGQNYNVFVTHYRPHLYCLVIKEALLSDTGFYTCVASNIAGTIRTSAYISVEKHKSSAFVPRRRRFLEN